MEHSYEDGLPLRKKALEELLAYYHEHSDYYAKNEGDKIEDYPVQTKLTLIANREHMTVSSSVIPGQKGTVFIQRTSGSTGTPLAMPQDTRKRRRRIAEIKYFGKRLGFKTQEKLIHLRIWNQWQSKSLRQIISYPICYSR